MRLLRYNSLTAFADWIIDHPDSYYLNQGGDIAHTKSVGLDYTRVSAFESVFVKTDLLPTVLNDLAKISVPWHLLTGNSDLNIQNNNADFLLNLENLVTWSGNNLKKFHDKCLAIPIGIANTGRLSPNTFNTLPEQNIIRPIKMCLTPLSDTHVERNHVRDWLQKNCYTVQGHLSWQDYKDIVSVSQFSVCPRGNGLDTHRVMESIILGALPVVRDSYLNEMYNKMGCKIINEWNDLYHVDFWNYSPPDQKYATFDYWLQEFYKHKTFWQEK